MRIALTGWLLWVTLSCALADPVTIAVTGAGGTPIEDAVVVLDPLDALAPPSNTPAVAVVDQIHKTFVPHIAVIRTGTAVSFPNSDRIRHQVYSFSPARTFNLKLYAGAAAPPVVFDHAGLVVLGCNIHDTMAAFVAVVDTPYFGRTDPKGRLRLEAPPGRYRLRVWHPQLAQPVAPRPVTIGPDVRTITIETERAQNLTAATPWTD